jgi:hypothetical protein
MPGKPRSRERCGSSTKTTGAPCRRPTHPGSHRCVMHSGPLTFEGRKRALEALVRGRVTVQKNQAMKRHAKEAARQWIKDFAPDSPLVDALVDNAHAAHRGALEHAKKLVAEMRNQ